MSLSTLHEGTVMEAGATDSRLSGAAGQAYSRYVHTAFPENTSEHTVLFEKRLPQDEEATHTAVNVPADSQRGPGNTLGMPPLHRSRSSTVSSIASDVSSVIVEPEPQPETPTTWKGRLQASRPILVAAGQFSALLLASLLFLYISIKLLLPPVKPEEAAKLKLPKSFEDLKDLNDVLQLYKESNYGNVLGSFVLVYLFLQCFSVPGSMYLSMIGGALFGLWALPLVCFVSTSDLERVLFYFESNLILSKVHRNWGFPLLYHVPTHGPSPAGFFEQMATQSRKMDTAHQITRSQPHFIPHCPQNSPLATSLDGQHHRASPRHHILDVLVVDLFRCLRCLIHRKSLCILVLQATRV